MKALSACFIGFLAVFALFMTADARGGGVSVRGYNRSNGTYVAPHVRTAPDNSKYDNWSSKPNVNPYTGKEGTKDPSLTTTP